MTTPHTLRFLEDRWDEAVVSLTRLRGLDPTDIEFKEELAEMHAQIEEEIQATSGRSIKELFQTRNFIRLMWGCGKVTNDTHSGKAMVGYSKPNALNYANSSRWLSFTCILPPTRCHGVLRPGSMLASKYPYSSFQPCKANNCRIFPTRIRDYGMSISVSVVWLMNFIVSKWTPTFVLDISWKTWIVRLKSSLRVENA